MKIVIKICNFESKADDIMILKKVQLIRTFGDNFAHARVKGHDCENGEYLNSK